MTTQPIWKAFSTASNFQSLNKDITVDTAIIGGGITGLATALELSAAGQQVAVLEALKIGGGTTSQSTGNLYSTVDTKLHVIKEKYDLETVKKVVASRQKALEQIAAYVMQYNIDCDFRRQPFYIYGTEENKDMVEQEAQVARDAGLEVDTFTNGQIPYPHGAAFTIANQAQYNPSRFIQGLATVVDQVCQLYENTKVTEIEEADGFYSLITAQGTVRAKHIVHATHSPKGVKLWHTLLGPYREYGIACKVRNLQHAEGIFWGYHGEKQDKFSTRTYTRDGQTFLLVIGKPHKVGQKEHNYESIAELEAFARQHFVVEEIAYSWGGQHYRPADGLPYIGRDGNDSESYIATGYSTDGLVWGVVAAKVITDLIMGRENELAELYDPTRKNMAKSAKEFLKENMNVAGQIAKDWLAIPESGFDHLAPGEGEIVTYEGSKIAAYKGMDGNVVACSAVCPHMGCIVHFNKAEKSWDCPCHGSRFELDGSVIEGPVLHALKKIETKRD